MSGITGTGLISGIDTASLVNQLVQLAARPRDLATQRLVQLQTQQAAFLDINSRMSALQDASSIFRTSNSFQAKRATSSDTGVLTATASNNAQPGTYTFSIDRLVSTQQMLSKGFQDRDTSAFGAESFTFEPERASLDRNTALADLNGGQGIDRGTIVINDGTSDIEVDLSTVATVNEVLDAINAVAGVSATVDDGSFVITGADSITSAGGGTTAESLGIDTSVAGLATIDGSTVTGGTVYSLTGATGLSLLNDGNGVSVSSNVGQDVSDFTISVEVFDGMGGSQTKPVGVRIGDIFDAENEVVEAGVGTMQGVIDRINAALEAEAVNAEDPDNPDMDADLAAALRGVTASIDSTTGAIAFSTIEDVDISIDSTDTAKDLGIDGLASNDVTETSQTLTGERILAGMNTVLLKSLAGGDNDGALPGNGELQITLGSDVEFTFDIANRSITYEPSGGGFPSQVLLTGREGFEDPIETVDDLLAAFDALPAILEAEIGGDAADFQFSVDYNSTGTGLTFQDLTGGTASNLTIVGTTGADTAAALGISTGAGGTTETSVSGSSQLKYISDQTRLDDLPGGLSLGTGEFRIVDRNGESATVNIGSSVETIGELLDEINRQAGGLAIEARINDNGDGIVIESTTSGGSAIEISDESGSVATRLGLAGTAEDNTDSNFLNGSFEKVVEFEAADTLDDALRKINDAGAGVTATVINDGSSTSPFRISLSSTGTGEDGRFLIDTGNFDLGLETLDEGDDARIFFGSSDPARSILITSSTNEVSDLIEGVDIDLVAPSTEPVTVTVTSDTSEVESQIEDFISAYNTVLDRIDEQTRFVEDTGERGALLGDTTLIGLQNALSNVANGTIDGFTQTFDRLVDVGITVGTAGRLEFDSATFRDALSADPDAVEELFTRRTIDPDSGKTIIPGAQLFDEDGNPILDEDGNPTFNDIVVDDPTATDEFTELGLLPLMEELARSYVDSIDGILTQRNNSLDDQIENQQDRIESLNEALDRERAKLEADFVAMEQALAQLQSQQSALAGLGG
ncbi:MAG: flagellar filament capping protein FliD [Planctomycetota bacterium]